MTYTDPVQVLRDAITRATGVKTVRVLQEGSLPDTWPLPLVHVYGVQSQDLDYERISSIAIDVYAKTPTGSGGVGAEALADQVADALAARPVVGASGWVDSVDVSSRLVVRDVYGVVEVVGLNVDATHRPTD
uniref:Tail completion protein n=1 Tax=Siphoviridae sp. ctJyX12 TaxID=2827840 RepID=A0A8S5SQQ5_9CAUD|nr:MAG TPA: tail completion protein [Siphoviridae sp. ctJyX12]